MAALYAINLTNPTLKSNFFVNFVLSLLVDVFYECNR